MGHGGQALYRLAPAGVREHESSAAQWHAARELERSFHSHAQAALVVELVRTRYRRRVLGMPPFGNLS